MQGEEALALTAHREFRPVDGWCDQQMLDSTIVLTLLEEGKVVKISQAEIRQMTESRLVHIWQVGLAAHVYAQCCYHHKFTSNYRRRAWLLCFWGYSSLCTVASISLKTCAYLAKQG
jgi:hypothetical protein